LNFDFPTEFVQEGAVKVLVPKLETFVKEPWEYAPSKAPVFYNPLMEFNRDLAVLAVQTYQRIIKRKISVCEPLTGCGIRGIRIAREVEGVDKVVISDISSEATNLAQFNVDSNNLTKIVKVVNEDANLVLSKYAVPRKRFDYVDIDPFGSPAPYLDSAVRALRNGSLLALTATDTAPLCGVHPEACMRKYGGKPLRTEYCHELTLRLLIGCTAMVAAKHDVGLHVFLSYSDYNHVRTYTNLRYGAKEADKNIRDMGFALHCFECFYRETNKGMFLPLKRECPQCGSRLHVAGPLWLGELWDQQFCVQIKKEVKYRNLCLREKISKMLHSVIEETKAPATYYVIDKICDKFNLPTPSSSEVMGKLRKLGFQVVSTHFAAKAFRTDAPAKVVKEVVIELSDLKANNLNEKKSNLS
jgi:tRNA (guanine26-N2/guanine27-N2)-dimethyltransferase